MRMHAVRRRSAKLSRWHVCSEQHNAPQPRSPSHTPWERWGACVTSGRWKRRTHAHQFILSFFFSHSLHMYTCTWAPPPFSPHLGQVEAAHPRPPRDLGGVKQHRVLVGCTQGNMNKMLGVM